VFVYKYRMNIVCEFSNKPKVGTYNHICSPASWTINLCVNESMFCFLFINISTSRQ